MTFVIVLLTETVQYIGVGKRVRHIVIVQNGQGYDREQWKIR